MKLSWSLSRSLEGFSWISKFHLTCTEPCQLVDRGGFESCPSVRRQRFTTRHAWWKRLAWFPISCLLPITDQKRWENISNIPACLDSLVNFYNVAQLYDLIYVNSLEYPLSLRNVTLTTDEFLSILQKKKKNLCGKLNHFTVNIV